VRVKKIAQGSRSYDERDLNKLYKGDDVPAILSKAEKEQQQVDESIAL
jgi:hypothetical protein